MSGHNIMARIPADLVPKLDRLARVMRERAGFAPDADCEITRAFVHHLALRRGIGALGRHTPETTAKWAETGAP